MKKTHQFKILAYLATLLFSGYMISSCEKCDEGNNFEDQQTMQVTDSLLVGN